MAFPNTRLRRLRQHSTLREMLRENAVSVNDLILPLFVRPGKNVRKPIQSLPGQFQLSVDQLVKETQEAAGLGIPAIILFGIPERKDAQGTEAFHKEGIVQVAIRAIKDKVPEMIVVSDLCFCEYTEHGHCGIIVKSKNGGNYLLDNDATLELIGKTAVAQAEAGADIIAPSGMIDGMVKQIRSSLDTSGFADRPILAYSAKYASSFYGPFREAAESAPQFGDRKTYQMDPANSNEALREVSEDIQEGADMVMVKPALAYLDIIRRVKDNFNVPVAAYNVSGEYAMVHAAAKNGWVDGPKMMLEILTSIKRAGADVILTYHAKEVSKLLGK